MKTAYVLAGGGSAGSIQAGVIRALSEGSSAKPNYIYGTSAGALNAFGYSHLGAEGLVELWKSIKKESDVFKKPLWPLLPWRNGFKNADPLRELLKKNTRTPTVPFSVCSLNLKTGEKTYTKHTDPDIINMTVASASMEGYIEPYIKNGVAYGDGGAVENVPLKQAILDGAEFIFVILCHPMKDRLDDDWKPDGILSVLGRTYKCRSLEMFRNDIAKVNRKSKSGRYRPVHVKVIAPHHDVLDVLDWDKIPQGLAAGYDLGKNSCGKKL